MAVVGVTRGRAGRSARRYVRWLAVLLAASSGSVLVLNLIVDPLWYLAGNQLSGVNYAFNERISKSNLFLKSPESYDCLILGSSRTTLLRAADIEGYRCFNYAVSQGSPADFEAIAGYAASRAPGLKLVIVGVDGYHFFEPERRGSDAVPAFMREGARPPDLLSSYLSMDVLGFSLRTLRGLPPNDRFYDPTFVTRVVPEAGPWTPPREIVIDEAARSGFESLPLGPFSAEEAARLHELHALVPGVRMLGYVPPLNAWYAAALLRAGTLDSYLDAIGAAAGSFDAFYDFSAPSPLTRDPSLTYDGHHYTPEANTRVAEVLNRGGGPLALPVHALDSGTYRARFREQVEAFLAETEVVVVERGGRE